VDNGYLEHRGLVVEDGCGFFRIVQANRLLEGARAGTKGWEAGLLLIRLGALAAGLVGMRLKKEVLSENVQSRSDQVRDGSLGATIRVSEPMFTRKCKEGRIGPRLNSWSCATDNYWQATLVAP
jgi:hypothetical protein